MGGYAPKALGEHSETVEKGSGQDGKSRKLLHPPPTLPQTKSVWWRQGEEVLVGSDSRTQPGFKEDRAQRVNSSTCSQTDLSLNLDQTRVTALEARDLKVHSRERGRCLFTAHSTVSAPQKRPQLAGCSRRKVATSTAQTGGGRQFFSSRGCAPTGRAGHTAPKSRF